ncbi:MAG: hypothetical protein ABJH20_15015 [Rhizobiaceae bacterium]
MHKSLIGLSFVALLAGCSGNTYGTGVSSEKQLVDDLGNMVTLDLAREKKRIEYPSRPKLVKPPEVAQLPTPAENVQAESAYFPENPEEKRKRLIANLEEVEANGGRAELSPELQEMRAVSLERSKTNAKSDLYATGPHNEDGECVPCEYRARKALDQQRLEQRTVARQNPTAKKRRYLTEPPTEYNVPAETAEVGVLGEKELSEAAIARQKSKKNEKSIFSTIFGG